MYKYIKNYAFYKNILGVLYYERGDTILQIHIYEIIVKNIKYDIKSLYNIYKFQSIFSSFVYDLKKYTSPSTLFDVNICYYFNNNIFLLRIPSMDIN